MTIDEWDEICLPEGETSVREVISNFEQVQKNMRKVCDYIEKNITDEEFDLAGYMYKADDMEDIPLSVCRDINLLGPKCGTVGCFIGHSVIALQDEISSELLVNDWWAEYSQVVSGIPYLHPAWDYLFVSRRYPRTPEENTRMGTVERVRSFYKIK